MWGAWICFCLLGADLCGLESILKKFQVWPLICLAISLQEPTKYPYLLFLQIMFFLVDSGSFGGTNQPLDSQYLTNNNNTHLVSQLIFSSSSTEKLS
jgi:hypothetical protein